LNKSLVDKKDPSNRYYFEELVVVYCHTCRYYKVARKIQTFKDLKWSDYVECFRWTLHSQPN
jgi:hypothetical protein